jgi:hypothetical protein
MKNTVLFFTRTGTSKRIAEKVAKSLGEKPIEITDDKNWSGILGFIKGGYYSAKGKSINIKVNGDMGDAERYIVVSPLWAGKPAPAICEFLKQVPLNKVYLIITCNGSDVGKDISKYEDKVGKFKGKFGIVAKFKDEDARIKEIIDLLNK